MKRSLRVLLVLLSLILLVIGVLWFRQPGLLRAYTIAWSDFEEVSPGIFVSPNTPDNKIDSLLLLVSQARHRNALFWGKSLGNQPIIYCHTSNEIRDYAAVSGQKEVPAAFYFTPVYSYVQVGPSGLNSEVLAHELCHPELFERIGWYHHEFDIPVWFFEGLAMQLDHRASYSDERYARLLANGEAIPELQSIADWPGFFGGDAFVNYTVARQEVQRWLKIVGKQGLFDLIDGMDEMKDFESLYKGLEMKSKEAQSNT